MPLNKRTIRDRDYSDTLKRLGPLTNSDLCKEAAKHPHFSGMKDYALEKDVDRFVKHYEYLGLVERHNGKIEWIPQGKPREQSSKERTVEPRFSAHPEIQRETVEKLIQGLANGSITLRDKPLQKELKGMKGKLYDKLMEDIDLYNRFKNMPLVSDTLERRVFEMALKLRAYGFLEERDSANKKENT